MMSTFLVITLIFVVIVKKFFDIFYRRNILHEAVAKSSDEELKSLLDQGTKNINSVNGQGQAPLHYAVNAGLESIVEILLTRGAKVNVKDNCNRTPLHSAAFGKSESIVQSLLARGAEVNARDRDGLTPLHVAASGTSEVIVEILLAAGAEVNVKDNNGETPLHIAASTRFVSAADLLLSKGAEVNTANLDGQTPLHCALYSKDNPLRILDKLLIWGASDDIKDAEGYTVSRLALESPAISHLFYSHFVKLECANLYLDFGKSKYFGKEDDINNCLKEIKEIKERKFGLCSLYDIFSKYDDPTFLSNEEMCNAFQTNSITYRFPVYGELLRTTFHKAKQRFVLLNTVQHIFGNPLPVEIKRKILSYLEYADLINIVKAYE